MDYGLFIFVLYLAVYFRRGVPSARTNGTANERTMTKKRRRWTKERKNGNEPCTRKQLGTKRIAERNDAEGVAGGRRSTYILYTASFGRGNG